MSKESDHTLYAANARTNADSSLQCHHNNGSSLRKTSNSGPAGAEAAPSMAIASPAKTSRRALTCQQMSRTIRRGELRSIVPLSDTTIYELEQQGRFPRRFYLTARCVVWDLDEVEAWLAERRAASATGPLPATPVPDVALRRTRPVKSPTRRR